jgi:SH3 domain protein
MKKISHWVLVVCSLVSLSVAAEEAAPLGQTAAAQDEDVKEIKYVTDKLRLSLYKSASGSGSTLKLLTSGDALKILELSGNYAKVRTDEGLVGWVKSGFLVSEPTASFQLIEEQKKNEILVNQLERYSDTQKLVKDYESTISLMQSDQSKMSDQLESVKQELEQEQQTISELEQRLEQEQQGVMSIYDVIKILEEYWYLVAAALISFLIVGFIAGKKMVEAQVKRRFQGMKVW